MPYRIFQYPIPGPEEPEALNAFLAGHAIVSVREEMVVREVGSWVVFVVEFLDATGSAGGSGVGRGAKAPRIDYRDVLDTEEFAVFSELRDLRKRLAEADGVPVYNVFTNAQLAEMVKKKVSDDAALKEIEGVGAAKVEKYGKKFLEALGRTET